MVVKFEKLKKTYKGRLVLDIESVEFDKNKIYAIIGANGSGKSTFAKVIAGIIAEDGRKSIHDLQVGYLPQKAYAFNMTTKKNILINVGDSKACKSAEESVFGGEISKSNSEATISQEDKAMRLMRCLNLDHLADSKAKGLSGGETAKMALARIMMKDYDVLILDEATAAMDAESTLLSEELVKEYKERTGCTVLVITHSLNQAKRLADEVIYMEKGKIVEQDAVEKLLNNPSDERTKKYIEFFGA